MALIQCKRLSKVFPDGTEAVSMVDLIVQDGEFAVLVGPSGCGKSTLLRMIAGLETVSEGEIHLDNQVVNDIAPGKRNIAMVFQNYAIYPHMSVYANLAFPLKMQKLGKDEIKRRVIETAELLEITPLLERKPKALSGGQLQRVALGRAMVRQPAVFLFDEPLSNLDAKLRVNMRAELIKLHKRLRATIIYVTHDQVEAMSMGERLVVLNQGRIQQVGRPMDIYQRPANTFVAGFIGSPPMNLLPCVIDPASKTISYKTQELGWDQTLFPQIPASDWGKLPLAILLGIRPEHMNASHDWDRALLPLKATVELLEPLGNEVLAKCRLSEQDEVTVRLAPDTSVRAGTAIELFPDLSKACLFDPKTQINLSLKVD